MYMLNEADIWYLVGYCETRAVWLHDGRVCLHTPIEESRVKIRRIVATIVGRDVAIDEDDHVYVTGSDALELAAFVHERMHNKSKFARFLKNQVNATKSRV